MLPQPTAEQIKNLSWIERFAYRFADFINRRMKTPFILWNYTFMNLIIGICLNRRIRIHGLENLLKLGKKDRIILAANHRTFFDFFIVTWITYNKTKLSKRIFFPVRSKFFYDNLLGIPLNLIMGGFAMFPPIMRDKKKKDFNRYAVQRTIAELKTQSAIVGFHPEGTRNKDPDPYTFLEPKPGVGEVILKCSEAVAVPIFICGVTNKVMKEFYWNWFQPKKHLIHVTIGAPLEFEEFRNQEADKSNNLKVSQHCMDAIKLLAENRKKSEKKSL